MRRERIKWERIEASPCIDKLNLRGCLSSDCRSVGVTTIVLDWVVVAGVEDDTVTLTSRLVISLLAEHLVPVVPVEWHAVGEVKLLVCTQLSIGPDFLMKCLDCSILFYVDKSLKQLTLTLSSMATLAGMVTVNPLTIMPLGPQISES